jgi:hypothetical protein
VTYTLTTSWRTWHTLPTLQAALNLAARLQGRFGPVSLWIVDENNVVLWRN